MINILYQSSVFNSSGYSEAARNYIAALAKQPEVNLSVRSVNFERWKTDQSAYSHIIDPLLNKPINEKVNIVHMTPENFPKYRKNGVYNIGYAAWETSKLPKQWPALCNLMNAIWVPSDWNVEVFKSSGVKVPVVKIPHTIDLSDFDKNIPYSEFYLPKDKFIFYSIFQWTERKNPQALIRAFLSEFSKKDNVALAIKSYRLDNSEEDKKLIQKEIHHLGQTMYLEEHAPVFLVHQALSKQGMMSFHKQGHCLVSPHRSEGWGCGPFESLAFGNPTIATNFSGNLEFMNNENSYLIDCEMTPVCNMPWPIYNGKMDWAEPSIRHLKQLMRHVYEHQEEAKYKAEIGQKQLAQFNWESVGKKMVATLKEMVQ